MVPEGAPSNYAEIPLTKLYLSGKNCYENFRLRHLSIIFFTRRVIHDTYFVL